ncbi:MAG: hypothetical protein FJW63_08560 [Actinobacteria bacterium]|nr:hypothetical protein [Actinomycetota bacterium]
MTTCPICKNNIDSLKFRSSRSSVGDVMIDKNGDLEWDIECDEIDEEKYYCPVCEEVIEIEEDKIIQFLSGYKLEN